MNHLLCRWFLFLALTISLPYSLRSQPDSCPSRICDTCSSPCTDEATKEIRDVFSIVEDGACALANPKNYPCNYDPINLEEFDFIVVGAGSAGCVVANRLTEDPSWSVLLLEAGGDPTKTSEVPALFPSLQKTDIDWQYQSNSDEDNCLGMNGNRCNLPRGKVLGGSSTINYMLYIRGNAQDYDDWEADGNPGWGYKDVLPYFKKLEDMRSKKVQELPYFNTYHSTEGPQKAEAWPVKGLEHIARVVGGGMKELGYPLNYDVNGPSQSGYVVFQGSLDHGKRCSTAKAYLTPAKDRDNLKVSKYSLVIKVLLDNKKNAYGVQFMDKQGIVKTVKAKKEVILSAGAINTPQLLMLSGIGPKAQLEKFNIPVVQDLPVGKNLLDHPSMLGIVITLDLDQATLSPEESMFEFLQRNDSAYSSIGMNAFIPMINTMTGPKGLPNMEIFTYNFAKNSTAQLVKVLDILNIKDEIQKNFVEIVQKSFSLLIVNSLITPSSTGSVELHSDDPKEHPNITTGYFTNQKDIDIYLQNYEFLYSLVDTKSMKNKNAKLHEIKIPGCEQYPLRSKMYRICTMRHITSTTYHQSGTCRMGPADSPDSVVDPLLRVKGVGRLRVVDASIFPKIPRGNTNIPVIMSAEKASDLIKAVHRTS